MSEKKNITAIVISLLCLFSLYPQQALPQDTVRVSHALYDKYFGTYKLGENHFITGGLTDEFEGHLIFRDYLSQKTAGGFFKPSSKTEFTSVDSQSIQIRFELDTNGNVEGMWWSEKGKEPKFAPKVFPHTIEQVSFANGDITLKGELTLPEGDGPYPVIVIVHGSGKVTRHGGPWNTFFLKYGIGVLSYDKRGSGKSTGNFATAGYKDFASDAVAAVEFLKKHPKVDASQIGLHGSSEGGWVAPIAATQSDISFMIIRAGSGVSARETYIHEFKNELKNESITDEQQIKAIQFMRELQLLALNKEPRSQADSLIQISRNDKWFSQVFGGWSRMSENEWVRMQKTAQIDPAVYLQELSNIPVIYFLAENDENIPTDLSKPRIKTALEEAGNNNFKIVVLPGANHAFYIDDPDAPGGKSYSPGYWDKMAEWLQEKVKTF